MKTLTQTSTLSPVRSKSDRLLGITLSGVVPFSTVDFPGALAAVLFFQGCPWKCPYCHNPHLRAFNPKPSVERNQMPESPESPEWTWEKARDFLLKRSGFLDGVVFSGGEPLVQSELARAMGEARAMGYRIGLHTSGSYPEKLGLLLPLIDWVGLDIKAPLDARYDLITGVRNSAQPVLASLALIMDSGISYQLRTTVHPRLHPPNDLEDLRRQLETLGAGTTVIQQFRAQGCLDADLIAPAA